MPDVDLAELERYIRIYQENPDSRVFAPLADLYRRLGRLEDAERLCREGLRRHPYYAGGRVALAHVLLEQGHFEDAASEATHVVTYYPDNLLARKILIKAQGKMGWVEQAKREFETLKVLAPAVAADPEITRAIEGPMPTPTLALSPGEEAAANRLLAERPPVPKRHLEQRDNPIERARKLQHRLEIERLQKKVSIIRQISANLVGT